ncbi:hypothetical protein ACIQVL_04950 [Streptomyces sp. NPDC090499]|uniref:hypothetical protein n=1 Tax=Streptomyces sp. NPDC090499 TaxID=3365965 RepID=UPI00381DE911
MTTIATLPDHDRRTDPLWNRLFNGYWHVITPLRHLGWITDVDVNDKFFIRANLGDGTEVCIATEHEVPVDAAEVTGWRVIRRDVDNPSRHTVLYDSAPGGPQSQHTTHLIPLFARIDALNAPKPPFRLVTSATYCAPYGLTTQQGGASETPGMAVARYFEWCQHLTTVEGYQRAWERPEPDGYPLAVFEKDGYLVAVRVTRSHD